MKFTKEQIVLGAKVVSIALALIGVTIIFKTSPIAVILIVAGGLGFYFAERA